VVGWTRLEDGLKKLDKMTNEEVAMASAQLLRITHNIDNRVMEVDDNVKAVDDKVQTMADGRERLLAGRSVISDFHHPDGKAAAKEVKSIVQQTADGVDATWSVRNQLISR
jgi:hypothetical protein